MQERDEIVEELKHLIRYYQQAAREFFDDTSNEMSERLEVFYRCLEENKNTLDDYKKMIDFLVSLQDSLKKKVEDLNYLTRCMTKLFESP